MRTFNRNLNAYHGLNTLNDIYTSNMARRLAGASTQEEIGAIIRESDTRFEEQRKLYKELGKEMVEIMNKKWWQFWK